METKRTVFFSQRLKYLLVIGTTLLPIVSILLMVFLTAYQPVFTSLEDIAIRGTNQMQPLRRLEVALLKSTAHPGKYLIHHDEQEREHWKGAKQQVEEAFASLMNESQLSSHRPFFQSLKRQWQEASSNAETLFQMQQSHIVSQNVEETMRNFGQDIDQISQQVAQLANTINDDIHAQFRNIQKLKSHGMILTCGAILIGLLVGIIGSIWLTRDRNKIVDLSLHDPLTGVLNRRGVDQELLKMKQHQLAYNPPCFSILLMDLDKFKQVNDQYGHDVGDIVLQHFSAITRSTIRSHDVFGRFGGEEFLLLLPGTEIVEAKIMAERIRQKIESSTVTLPAEIGHISVTVSIGCSTFSNSSDNLEDILKKADEAMYRAKEEGRNRVVCG